MNMMSPLDGQKRAATPVPDDSMDDAGSREIRYGWMVIIAFFGLFLGWALFVRMDAAAYATGTIAVSGNRQVVQHREGGTVAKIEVKEGQRVTKGQVLIMLAGGDVIVTERTRWS